MGIPEPAAVRCRSASSPEGAEVKRPTIVAANAGERLRRLQAKARLDELSDELVALSERLPEDLDTVAGMVIAAALACNAAAESINVPQAEKPS